MSEKRIGIDDCECERCKANPEKAVKYGLCHCGCGNDAPLSMETKARKGVKKGEPRFYCVNHKARKHDISGEAVAELYRTRGLNSIQKEYANRGISVSIRTLADRLKSAGVPLRTPGEASRLARRNELAAVRERFRKNRRTHRPGKLRGADLRRARAQMRHAAKVRSERAATTLTCEQCGVQFTLPANEAKNRRFHTLACWYTYQRESTRRKRIEAETRKFISERLGNRFDFPKPDWVTDEEWAKLTGDQPNE